MPAKNINSESAKRLLFAEDSLLNTAIKIDDRSKAMQIANNVLQAISQDPSLDRGERTKVIINLDSLISICAQLR